VLLLYCVCGGWGNVAILRVRKDIILLREKAHVYSEDK
jgi:hypothetical protein